MAGSNAIPPTQLPTSPDAVQHRFARQALVVRSLWFPTRAELLGWADSGCPVYFTPLGPGRFAVGPRLGAMWASVFSPRFVGEITPAGSGSRVVWSVTYDPITWVVLGIWVVLVGVWGGSLWMGFQPNGLIWWCLIALVTAATPVVGAVRGGSALRATIPWLIEILLAPDEEEDW